MNKKAIIATLLAVALVTFTATALAQTSQSNTPKNCFGTTIQGITMSQQCVIFSDNAWDDLMLGTEGIDYIKTSTLFHDKHFKVFCGTEEQTQAAKNARAICQYKVKQ